MADDPPVADLPPLISLLETLELLLAQAQAYESALSAREAGARVAAARLAELTQKALNEAREVPPRSPQSPQPLTHFRRANWKS